jgi:hypothetical protein
MLIPEALDILKKHFVFDKIFNLLEYDLDMQRLYDDLKLLTRESYDANYRFIFLHYDTEYYITNDTPGTTLINLQKILESLDISNFFCILLTQQNLQPICNQLSKEFTSDDCSIAVITNFLHKPIHPTVKNCELEINATDISKKYISLNRVGRFHRRVLVALLKYKNLLRFGMVSYHGK